MKITRPVLLLSVFISFIASHPVFCAEQYLYKQISLNTNLPTTLSCIFADTRGFIWTGTQSGLGRFDGHEQKRYIHQRGDSTSLPGNTIYQILEDDRHDLWVLTDRGIARYNYHSNDFTPLTYGKGESCVAYSICQRQGRLLFGGMSTIYGYTPADGMLKKLYELKMRSKKQFEITKILPISPDLLLCCSRWEGIHAINLRTGACTSSPFACGKEIMDMFIDSRQRIWIAPYNQGLQCFSTDGEKIASYTTRNSPLSNDIVLSITERKGQIWIATDGGGINILNPDNHQFTHLKHVSGDKLYSLPTNSIKCLHNDSYNNIWIGGVYNGLINLREVSMHTYTDVSGNDSGLSHNIVLCLYQETPEYIWIGTDGGGINRFNPITEKFAHYASTREDKVTSICEFTSGKLLYAAFSAGIFIFDMETGTKTPFNVIDEKTTDTLSKHGFSVYLYRNTPNTILLLSNHVYIYNLRNKTFTIATEEKESPIDWGTLQAIANGDGCTYLFDSNRIYALNHHTSHLKTLFTRDSETILKSVSRDREGNFWIGTTQGLSCYNSKTGKIKSIQTNLFTDVSLVMCNTPEEIWIGAENMLFSYSPQEDKFIIYGESDGVMPNEYIPRAQLAVAHKGIYMGGVKGLLHIANGNKPNIVSRPELQLSDIICNGESVNSLLDHNQDALSVGSNSNITILMMTKEEDIFRKKLYRYRIVGLDNTYTESYSPEIVIRAPNPGNYKIMVSCTAKDGDWIPDQQILALEVLPPWYQTWWFIGGYCLLISFLIIEVFRRILKRKERKLKWAMKEHEQQVYEEKVRFLINISHELRTPLTLIYAPLKRILKALPPEDRQYLPLKAIYRQSQRMKSLINMVLDVRKMEVEEAKLHIQPYPLNQWIEQAAQDFANEGEAEQVHIRYQLDPRIGMVSFDKEKCEIVLSNLLINALKHSPQNTVITIASELLVEGKEVRVSVSDQGCGLQQVNMDKLFTRFYQGTGEKNGTGIGLSYSKILIEQHNGSIGVHNNQDAGATFYFDLPMKQDEEEIVCQPKAYLNELIADESYDMTQEEENYDTSQYTLLIADDNPDMTDFLQKSLGESFKKVITASDGVEALCLAKSQAPDIIISDVMMPRMNGYELCKRIKEDIALSHIPVILLTARDDEQSQKAGYKNGADSYLAKPFEIDVLLELIRSRLKNRECIRKRYMNAGPVPVPEDTTFSQADETFLLKLNKIIQDNIDNCTLDIALICKEIGMSRASLYNKLKALTDMSTNEYVNKFRMEKAIRLINDTDLVFADIAEKVGFATSSYFSTAFKQYTGETPTQYKKKIKG